MHERGNRISFWQTTTVWQRRIKHFVSVNVSDWTLDLRISKIYATSLQVCKDSTTDADEHMNSKNSEEKSY